MNPGAMIICPNCRHSNPATVRYCNSCGAPIAPDLLVELTRLYDTLAILDRAIADGKGQTPVSDLRQQMLTTYLDLLGPQAGGTARAPGAAPAPTATTPTAQPAQTAPVAPVAAPPQTPPLAAPAPVTLPLAQSAPTTPPGAAQPAQEQVAQPVFSWGAFIADQAIAIMAYLGGFLLLIATLTFEVSGWNQLSDSFKLAGVSIVYLLFGGLGIGLRPFRSLRTVAGVYLGVFALMTPLEALAFYRFSLQAHGFPIAGMVCIAAFYAAAIYLALAQRTRFATYGYLGWAAALLGVIAIPEWANLSGGWWNTALALAGLGMLVPYQSLRRRATREEPTTDAMESLAIPALWISGLASVVAGMTALVLLLGAMASAYGTPNAFTLDTGPKLALALTFIALTILTPGWRVTLRQLIPNATAESLAPLTWITTIFGLGMFAVVALALNAGGAVVASVLGLGALAWGLAASALGSRLALERYEALGVRGLTIAAAGVALLYATPFAVPNLALIVTSGAGLALALFYALSAPTAETITWGIISGIFALIGLEPVCAATIGSTALGSQDDTLPGAALEWPSVYVMATAAFAVIGLGLRGVGSAGSRPRQLRLAAYTVASLGALITLGLQPGHTAQFNGVTLGTLAIIAYLCGLVERQPIPFGGVAAFLGSLAISAAIGFTPIEGNTALLDAALAPVIALLALGAYWFLGRTYAVSLYIVAFIGALVVLTRQLPAPDGLTFLTHAPYTLSGMSALVVTLLVGVAALRERQWGWQSAPAFLGFLCIFTATGHWPAVALTLALAAVGALARWRRNANWGAPWQVAALLASFVTLASAQFDFYASSTRTLVVALIFLVAAWGVAWLNRNPWWTVAILPYTIIAFAEITALSLAPLPKLEVTVGLTLALAAVGGITRFTLGRNWGLAFYGAAVYGSLATIGLANLLSEPTGVVEAVLLVYAAVALWIALVENSAVAALAPAIYAATAAFAQPDAHALLPLALGLAAAAFVVSRTRGGYWALSLYGAALFAAGATAVRGLDAPTFEPLALLTLALAAWIVAALESEAGALLIAYVFAWLAVPAAGSAWGWSSAGVTGGFIVLSWFIALSEFVWALLPWLTERQESWLVNIAMNVDSQTNWNDSRELGHAVARFAALAVGVLTFFSGLFAPDAFATGAAQTEMAALALLSLAGLLVVEGGLARWRLGYYLAGEVFAIFVTWQLRFLGFDNLQAWIIAPGSAQIIIGALIPNDRQLNAPRATGQIFSVAGALLLTLPTLAQSFSEPQGMQTAYALGLAFEALLITLIGVGLRNRLLALTGSAFVGVAALRAIFVISESIPTPVIIGLLALGLLALATWLSLRARHDAERED